MADITPYDDGGTIENRIGEIVAKVVDVHFQMLAEDSAFMAVGPDTFRLFVRNGELICQYRERVLG